MKKRESDRCDCCDSDDLVDAMYNYDPGLDEGDWLCGYCAAEYDRIEVIIQDFYNHINLTGKVKNHDRENKMIKIITLLEELIKRHN